MADYMLSNLLDKSDKEFEVSTVPFDLSKERSELLTARLKKRNLLAQSTQITFDKKRDILKYIKILYIFLAQKII